MNAQERAGLYTVFLAVVYTTVVWAAESPRLLDDEVVRLSNAKVREADYIPEAYIHSSPVYVSIRHAWEIDYAPKQTQHGAPGAILVDVDDPTGFASLTFGPLRNTVVASQSPASLSDLSNCIYGVGLSIGLAIAFVRWLRGKPVRRFPP